MSNHTNGAVPLPHGLWLEFLVVGLQKLLSLNSNIIPTQTHHLRGAIDSDIRRQLSPYEIYPLKDLNETHIINSSDHFNPPIDPSHVKAEAASIETVLSQIVPVIIYILLAAIASSAIYLCASRNQEIRRFLSDIFRNLSNFLNRQSNQDAITRVLNTLMPILFFPYFFDHYIRNREGDNNNQA